MSELLGIAVCDECNARIRVEQKFKHLIGTTVRCPKCHTRFKLFLDEQPATRDLAAVEAENDSDDKQAKKKRRRSRSEIRDQHIQVAFEGFRTLHGRLKTISEAGKSSEEQVRVWCIDVLRTALGFDDSHIDTECHVLGGRVDIAIKEDDRIQLIIECKNVRSRLRNPVRDQAGAYAATLSAPWAVVTNGDIWKLYRVSPQPGRSPRMDLVFDVALLDEDGISESDAEHLYLLSHRALSTGDTERQYHSVMSTSPVRVYESLFSERVLAAIRIQLSESYKCDFNEAVKLSNEDASEAVHELLTPLEFGQ